MKRLIKKIAEDFDEKQFKNLDDMNKQITEEYSKAGYTEAKEVLDLYHQISEIYTKLEMDYDIEVGDVFTQDIVNDFENGVKAFDSFGFKLQRKLDELSNVKVNSIKIKKLVKHCDSEKVYKFYSPIMVNFGDEQSWKSETTPLTVEKGYESTIKDAVDESMSSLGPSGLAQYFRGGLGDVIKSIIVTVQNCEAVTIVTATEELTPEELDEVKEYITGQFSDGWGEGFEQQTLDEWDDSYESEEWDEEEQEHYKEDVPYKATMSASFWSSKNWNITLK